VKTESIHAKTRERVFTAQVYLTLATIGTLAL